MLCPVSMMKTELSGSLMQGTVGMLETRHARNKTCEISGTGNCALSYNYDWK